MLKKIFQTIGMISLICVSFIFTEKTANVVRELDEIMIEIKEKSKQYKQEPIDAIVNDNTIIPGINGIIVDEKNSYKEMKRIGSFNENVLVYQQIKPNITINKNYDKYIISGNKTKKQIAIVFLVENNDKINNILNLINEQDIKTNFFIDSIWLEENNEKLSELIEMGHIVGNLSYNQDYSHSDFIWIDTILKKVSKQKIGYCYTEEKKEDLLNTCSLNKNHTIIPNIIIQTNSVNNIIKSNLENGSIMSIQVNELLEKELPLILKFIKSKGYKIVNLEELLSEQFN